MTEESTKEYLQRAADTVGEVLEHFVIMGVPRVTPEQDEEGVVLQPVMQVSGQASLLCMIADQTAVELRRMRDNLEGRGSASDGPSIN